MTADFSRVGTIAELHVDRGGRDFEVWVWGSRRTITMEQLTAVAPLVDDLVQLDRRILASLAAGFVDGSEECRTFRKALLPNFDS
jgi:hypothetical protein